MSAFESLNVIDKALALPDRNSEPNEYVRALAFHAAIDYFVIMKESEG